MGSLESFFDSSKLIDADKCASFCEKVTGLERIPFFGFAVVPTDDFTGVRIEDIIEGTAADESTLQEGDIITAVESMEITNPCHLTQAVNDQSVDEWVQVNYTRDGKSKQAMVLMGYRIRKKVTWVPCCNSIPNETQPTIQTSTGALDLNIFPNPTAGITQFEIGTTSFSETTIQLMNMNGQVLKEMKVLPIDGYWQDYLDLSKYADGVYVLHVTQDKSKKSERIILQKK